MGDDAVWQMDKILCHQLLLVEKLSVSFDHWCCLSESKRLLTPPEVKFRRAHLQIVHANAGN